MVAAFLNYLFYPFLGRVMNVSDFGEVQVIVSLLAQLGVLFGFFGTVVVNVTTNVEDPGEQRLVIAELKKIALIIAGSISVIVLVLSNYLKYFFHFSSVLPFIVLAAILPVSIVGSFLSSYLQGKKEFKKISIGNILTSFVRLAAAVVLVMLGMRAFGAVTGLLLAQAASYFYLLKTSRARTRDDIKNSAELTMGSTDMTVLEKGRIIRELWFGFVVLCMTSCLTLLYTSDVLVVKHYFPPVFSGIYAGVSTVGNILYFGLVPISGVMIAFVKIKNSPEENKAFFLKSLGIVVSAGIVGLLLFCIFNSTIVHILIGTKYLSAAYLLPRMGISMFLIAVLNIIFSYYIALRNYSVFPIAIAGVALVLILTILRHATPVEIIDNFIITTSSILIFFICLYAKNHFSRRAGAQ